MVKIKKIFVAFFILVIFLIDIGYAATTPSTKGKSASATTLITVSPSIANSTSSHGPSTTKNATATIKTSNDTKPANSTGSSISTKSTPQAQGGTTKSPISSTTSKHATTVIKTLNDTKHANATGPTSSPKPTTQSQKVTSAKVPSSNSTLKNSTAIGSQINITLADKNKTVQNTTGTPAPKILVQLNVTSMPQGNVSKIQKANGSYDEHSKGNMTLTDLKSNSSMTGNFSNANQIKNVSNDQLLVKSHSNISLANDTSTKNGTNASVMVDSKMILNLNGTLKNDSKSMGNHTVQISGQYSNGSAWKVDDHDLMANVSMLEQNITLVTPPAKATANPASICKENEELLSCAAPPPCQARCIAGTATPLPCPKSWCWWGCQCKSGYLRNKEWNCVLANECA